jgi:hypothetical protein
VETIQMMDTGKKMEKANQYKNIKEETPKDLSFPM